MNNACRYSKISVNSYDSDNMKGFISNPFYEKSISFTSTMDFLKKMQDIIEEMEYPKPYQVMRSFEAEPICADCEDTDDGKLATFVIKVLFCQNSSWQGVITWNEGKKEQPFRSSLEMLFMINSAIKTGMAS